MQFWRFVDPQNGLGPELVGTMDYRLGLLALVIATIAALAMYPSIERVQEATTRRGRWHWLLAGSAVMAAGIWGMHFTAMLAFSLPVLITYDVGMTIVSIVPALVGCGFALFSMGCLKSTQARILAGALAFAVGIGTMHYIGMEAMHSPALMRYDIGNFLLSFVVAYVLAVAALLITFVLKDWLRNQLLRASLAAIVFGGTVACSHFVAMSATHFYSSTVVPEIGLSVDPVTLAVIIGLVCLVIVISFLLTSIVDKRLTVISNSLEESEIGYGSVLETMIDCHLVIDEQGCIRSFNKAAELMFGYSAKEVLGRNVNMLMAKQVARHHDRYLRAGDSADGTSVLGKVREFDDSAQRKNGEHFPVELRTNAFITPSGKFYSGIIRDISTRRAAEEKNESLAAAIENTTENLLVVDGEEVVRYANPAFIGYANGHVEEAQQSAETEGAASLVGRPLAEIICVGNEAGYADISEAMRAKQSWLGAVNSKLLDGNILEEELTMSPVRDAAGYVSQFVFVIRDVTEKNIRDRQLSQAQKLESIGQLAAGIAHEINTPTQYVGDNTRFLQDAFGDIDRLIGKLRALKLSPSNCAEMLKSIEAALEEADVEYLQEEIPRAIEQSLDGVGRVSRIVRAMKEFSHPAQDKTDVDLNKAIESTITVASNEWKYVAELETDFDLELPMVSCLPGEFNQVILNIVVNAAHAIADVLDEQLDDMGKISVQTQRAGEWAEIRIADSGGGIPDEIKERVFDPFYTTKEVGKGTGQGLSIAYNVVVEKHGGTISIESEPGKGTCFVIRLPLDDVPADTDVAA